jgi:predicted transcriptional regulator
MATTVHLPPELMERVDRRARELGMSRNLYIRRALERAIDEEASWSPDFLKMLGEAALDVEGARAVDEMRIAIASGRTRKKPPKI